MKPIPCLLLCCITVVTETAAQNISTIAGNGSGGYNGDDIAASTATLNSPFGIAFSNSSGNLYIADRANNRVRMVNSSGIITTIAGNGTNGYGGDGGAATAAQLADPVDVAVDNDGFVYIADRGNNRIRRVDPAGLIQTYAGTSTAGFYGDNGPATLAQLNSPRGVAADNLGNIFVSDQGNNRIRKINPSFIVTTIAGTATAGYNGDGIAATTAEIKEPYGIAADGAGNVFFSDVDNERIRKIDATGTITTIAGNGTAGYNGDGIAATTAQLSEPIDVNVDAGGNVFIADGWNSRVRAITKTGLIYTVAGNGLAGFNGDGNAAIVTELNDPYSVVVDAGGNIYIADYANDRIRYMTRPTATNTVTSLSNGIRVFPDPNKGAFTMEIEGKTGEEAEIVISDIMGETIRSFRGNTNTDLYVQLTAPAGLYFLSAVTASGRYLKRILLIP